MKTFFNKRSVCWVCLMAVLLLLPMTAMACTTVAATETTPRPEQQNHGTLYYDCTGDQMQYGAVVAALNRGEIPPQPAGETEAPIPSGESGGTAEQKPETGQAELTEGSELTALLCRSREADFDFNRWEPDVLVAGPQNCYTLFFTDPAKAERACRELTETDGIRYAEPDAEVNAF